MKYFFIKIALGITLIVVGILFYKQIKFFLCTSSQASSSNKKIEKAAPVKKIALMIPATHPALGEICEAFTKEIELHMPVVCDIFNAQGNRSLMRSQAEEIFSREYDLIVTVGASCSMMIHSLLLKNNQTTPFLFTAVSNPKKLGIMTPGVIEETNYTEQINLLCTVKPSIKKMLLVCDATQGTQLADDKNEIEQICKKRGIELLVIEVQKSSEIMQKTMALLSGIDVILVLKDNTVVVGIDSLIKIANEHRITLFVSDLNSGKKGAVLSYGVYEYEFGKEVALLAKQLFSDPLSYKTLGEKTIEHKKFMINTTVQQYQLNDINHTLMQLLKAVVVI